MRPSTITTAPDPVAGATVRLALRQQNLAMLMPALLHDVNGSLNGLSLSTELLSRLQQRETADPASAASLLLRTRNELGRLRVALKALESRVSPGVAGQAPARESKLLATLQEVQAALLPALRRGQHDLDAPATIDELAVEVRPDDLFDLLAGLAIVTIEGAPSRSALELLVGSTDLQATVTLGYAAQASTGIGLEIHRELLRAAALQSGGAVEWQQSAVGSRVRLSLPRSAKRP